MGLARASLHHAEKLKSLRPRLESLLKQSDLHVVNKLHLARCLTQIEGGKTPSPELAALWSDVNTPPHGVVVRDGLPAHGERVRDFNFDYEFKKYKVPGLARLFGISDNEASDRIAEEVLKRWPDVTSMSDFPGTVRYRDGSDDSFETYREHVQRHALLHAATTLVKSRPVVRSSYESEEGSPWQEWLRENDVSFKDGSWLADHKDQVPAQAREYLLGKRIENQETLVDRDALLKKIGFLQDSDIGFQPLYGHWKSIDGVYVRIVSALIKERGALGKCTELSKAPDHDLWLPMFASDGLLDRFNKEKRPFAPLIWEPETYPIGIDQGDEWAARGAIARPRLGKAICRRLGLTADAESKRWYNRDCEKVLENQVWGEWFPDPDVRNHRSQDGGAILWAEIAALDSALESYKCNIIHHISFSKYKSSRDYDDSSGVKGIYVGLKGSGKPTRFWYAKKASETVR